MFDDFRNFFPLRKFSTARKQKQQATDFVTTVPPDRLKIPFFFSIFYYSIIIPWSAGDRRFIQGWIGEICRCCMITCDRDKRCWLGPMAIRTLLHGLATYCSLDSLVI